MNAQKRFVGNVAITSIIAVVVMVASGFFAVTNAGAQEATAQAISPERASVQQYGFIAAAVAFGLGAIGAGIAIGNVGSAAMGAIGERPEIAGQALIFIALAEGLVVFGFITALMILGKV